MLIHFSAGLVFLNVSPITPHIMEGYEVSRGTVGLLVGCILLFSALSSIPFSLLVGRVRINVLVLIFLFGISIPVFSAWAPNFTTLLILRICFGISVGGLFPTLAPVLMSWFPKKELPLMNGIQISAISAGIAASFLLGESLADTIGWNNTLTLFSSVSLISTFLWLILSRDSEKTTNTNLSFKQIKEVFLSKITLLLAVADAGPLIQYVALSSWLPTYYFEIHNMSLSDGSAKTAVLPICGLIVVLTAGFLSLKFNRRKPFLFASGIVLGIGGFSSVIFADSPFLLLVLIVYGIGAWLYTPFHATIPLEAEESNPEKAAAITACIFTIGGLLSFISPIFVGYMADLTGSYIYGFGTVGILSWSLVVATIFLPETGSTGRNQKNYK
ncbi:MAG: MFS transporter [SAR202 cluster bacterium]|nr:MFS transporter [SAR202 cluster bacterium]